MYRQNLKKFNICFPGFILLFNISPGSLHNTTAMKCYLGATRLNGELRVNASHACISHVLEPPCTVHSGAINYHTHIVLPH